MSASLVSGVSALLRLTWLVAGRMAAELRAPLETASRRAYGATAVVARELGSDLPFRFALAALLAVSAVAVEGALKIENGSEVIPAAGSEPTPAPEGGVLGPDAVESDAPSPVATPAGRWHVVAAGETLRLLARRYYGDETLWPRILDANRARIISPEQLRPGQQLFVPSD